VILTKLVATRLTRFADRWQETSMTEAMHYRELQPGDLRAVFRVRVATWHNDNGAAELHALGITPERVTHLLKTSHRGWVCEVDQQIVGFAMGNVQTGEMWVIAVLAAYEGRGIGGQLFRRVEDLPFASWPVIWLTTDTDESLRAVGFYRHLGGQDWKLADGDRYMKKVRSANRQTAAPARPQ